MFSHANPISGLGDLADTSIQSLPSTGLLVVIAVMVGGILMWSFGGRMVRPLYGVLFGAAGSACGLFLPASVGLSFNPFIGIGVGAVAGLLAGLLLFRLSMATALAMTGAVLAPLAVTAILWLNPSSAPTAGVPLTGDALLLSDVPVEGASKSSDNVNSIHADNSPATDAVKSFFNNAGTVDSQEADSDATDAATAIAHTAADRLGAFVGELASEARSAWVQLPAGRQLTLGISSAIGALAGFLIGLSFPKKVASIGAAFVGAGVWAPIAAKLMNDYSVPGHAALPTSARGWLALWLFVAAAGLALQWTILKPKADKPARSQ